jgi:hypothetical protein
MGQMNLPNSNTHVDGKQDGRKTRPHPENNSRTSKKFDYSDDQDQEECRLQTGCFKHGRSLCRTAAKNWEEFR